MCENQYSKANGWIDFFFLMFSVLEAKIAQYGFLDYKKNIRCAKITIIDRQRREWSRDYGD